MSTLSTISARAPRVCKMEECGKVHAVEFLEQYLHRGAAGAEDYKARLTALVSRVSKEA